MKLEYLKDTTVLGHFSDEVNEQMIRLYDFDANEAKQFCLSVQQLIIEGQPSLNVSLLDFVDSMNCQLEFKLCESDEGIHTIDQKHFICDLTVDRYKKMIELCTPFSQHKSRGFVWLYSLDNPIDFLFSPHGTW